MPETAVNEDGHSYFCEQYVCFSTDPRKGLPMDAVSQTSSVECRSQNTFRLGPMPSLLLHTHSRVLDGVV